MSLTTLVMDIEISPHLTYTYDTYEADVVKMVRPQFILSFAYKKLGSKKVTVVSLPDFKSHYKRKPYSDQLLCKELARVLSETDLVIGHNFKKFDMRKINARFLYWGMKSPPHVQIIDTLLMFRRVADCPGNSMAKLSSYLGLKDEKLHFGIDDWISCIEGDREAWKREKEYQMRDVNVNEEIYYKLRSFIPNHPHLNPDTSALVCHACRSSRLRPKGFRYYPRGGAKRRFLCRDCGVTTSDIKVINITSMRP